MLRVSAGSFLCYILTVRLKKDIDNLKLHNIVVKFYFRFFLLVPLYTENKLQYTGKDIHFKGTHQFALWERLRGIKQCLYIRKR